MHRSTSLSRTSEEFFIHAASPSSKSSLDTSELPVYDPNSDVGKKEKMRIKFAENAVHIIPVVLVLCAVILWCFSSTEGEMVSKDRSIVSKIDGLTIDGDIDVHGSGTGLLSSLDQEDSDPQPKKVSKRKAGKGKSG